jgi:recombination protein RecR
LGLDLLKTRLEQSEVEELILATSQTVEGEATSHYIAQLARQLGVRVSRLAQGLPMGGELEYTDSATLAYAFKGRRQVEH